MGKWVSLPCLLPLVMQVSQGTQGRGKLGGLGWGVLRMGQRLGGAWEGRGARGEPRMGGEGRVGFLTSKASLAAPPVVLGKDRAST